jgi:hypothetical protein
MMPRRTWLRRTTVPNFDRGSVFAPGARFPSIRHVLQVADQYVQRDDETSFEMSDVFFLVLETFTINDQVGF